MARCWPEARQMKDGEWVVQGEFDADAARVIANALDRALLTAEADVWRDAARDVEEEK